jgi:hypothetical protein
MIVPTKTRGRWTAAMACLLAGSLVACADGRADGLAVAAQPASLRVMVKLVHASEDANAISAEASRIAGVPVSYAAATSQAWHALVLHCATAAECDTALARLRGANATYQTVEIDSRKSRLAS